MKKVMVIFLMIILSCGLLFASGDQEEGGTAGEMEGPEEILIGCNAPLTGVHSGFGEGNVYGIQAAVDDINAQGGIYVEEYGRKIPARLIVVDNQSDPRKAGSLEESLILDEKVHFLCDPNQPIPLAVPESIAAERHKIVRVSGGSPEEAWLAVRADADPMWNHTWTITIVIGAPAPEGSIYNVPGYTAMDTWGYILEKYGDETNKQVGVFASDEPDGRSWYEVIPGILEGMGMTPHTEDNLGLFSMDTTDFSTMIQKWKRLNIEVVWGNSPAPLFGTMWRQCKALGFTPKLIIATRAGLYYEDVSAWGGDLPVGVSGEAWWSPSFDPVKCPGINGTTPMSLFERWQEDTGRPLNPGIGYGYSIMQILHAAIESAGSLDTEEVNKAMGATDVACIGNPRVNFDPASHSSRFPVFFNQWQKVDKPWKWESKVVYSPLDFVEEQAELVFPLPAE